MLNAAANVTTFLHNVSQREAAIDFAINGHRDAIINIADVDFADGARCC